MSTEGRRLIAGSVGGDGSDEIFAGYDPFRALKPARAYSRLVPGFLHRGLIGIAGNSAGGHMVALIGTSNGNKELEGNVGGNKIQSSYVQAIVSYYGASNLTTILGQSTPHGLNVRVPALKLLLGDTPDKTEALAKLASPVFHVDKNDPPLLLLHGDQDPQMPINQAHELHAGFKAQKLDVHFEVIHGAAHGGKAFYDPERNTLVKKFFDRTLKK